MERRNNYFCYNRFGVHPIQTFANASYPPQLRDRHTCGFPIFVLQDKARELLNPKWDPKAWVGIYLGQSPIHTGSVALVLNPRTLHVSPQFHVIFDDDFTTVPCLSSTDMPPTNLTRLCTESRELATDTKFELATLWTANTYQEDTEDLEYSVHPTILNKGDVSPKVIPQLDLVPQHIVTFDGNHLSTSYVENDNMDVAIEV